MRLRTAAVAKTANITASQVTAAGSGTAVLARRALQAVGLDHLRDVREQSLGVAQSVDALKDGKVDAFFWSGGLPTAAILDLMNTPGVKARLVPTRSTEMV